LYSDGAHVSDKFSAVLGRGGVGTGEQRLDIILQEACEPWGHHSKGSGSMKMQLFVLKIQLFGGRGAFSRKTFFREKERSSIPCISMSIA